MTADHSSTRFGLSRRGFLGTAAMGATLGWAHRLPAQPSNGSGGSGGSGGGTSQGTRIRRNIYALAQTAEGRATIDAYREGVKVMMARPFSDVTSWRFQAAIHWPDAAAARDFASLPVELQLYLDPQNLCQHGNGRFLPWHRMYVYFFERIVRKASGKADFSLPYWNYSDSPAERAMPEAFRTPSDEATNALYRAARRQVVNDGWSIDANFTTASAALREPTAGPRGAQSGFYTAIEGQPHNIMHNIIGGTGLMSNASTAALDPIFWMHHCNIDRVWTRWIALGRANLSDAAFLDRVHRFWDEDGNAVEMTTREVMDTVTRLDYRYDDATAPEAGIVVLTQAETGVEAGAQATLLAASAAPVTLTREGVTAEAQPLVEAGGAELLATTTPAQLNQPVILRLDDIRFTTAPHTIFEVYLNAPEGTAQGQDPDYFAGLFAPFAPPREGEVYGESFDVSGLINRQIEAGIYEGGPVAVEIVPAVLPGDETGTETGVEAGALPEIVISRISLSR